MLESPVEFLSHCCCLTALIFTLLMLQCNCTSTYNGCSTVPNSIGFISRRDDFIIEYGKSLEIYCNLDLNHNDVRGYNASNLSFTCGGKDMSKEFIQVLNASTIKLFKKNPPPGRDVCVCVLRKGDKEENVCASAVIIGFKPQEVKNFTCYSMNWDNFTCKWTKPENYIETKYTLGFFITGSQVSRRLYSCPNGYEQNVKDIKKNLKVNEDLCFWSPATVPQYRQIYEYYYFVMYGKNELVRAPVKFDEIKFHHHAHVIPSPPDSLATLSNTPHSVLLKWRLGGSLPSFPPGIIPRVQYHSEYDDWDTWYEANTSSLNFHGEYHTFNLTGLKYANALYDIRVSMKSFYAVGDDKWSEPAKLAVRTDSTIPSAAPRVDIGSFEDVPTSGSTRDIYVYWQKINNEDRNGKDFKYKVISVKENGIDKPDIKPFEVKDAYAKFRGLSFNSHQFTIVASNCHGNSEIKSVVNVPSKIGTPPEPSSFTKIAFDYRLYELSWKAPQSDIHTVENYTIFWCRSVLDLPYQCNGLLQWTHLGSNISMFNITVPEDSVYQFAISANTKTASSGMVWAFCTVIHNKVAGKMKNVWVKKVGSNYIDISWRLECSDRIGKVKEYHVVFCPIVSPYNTTCKEPEGTEVIDPSLSHGNVTGLKPYTTYMVSVAAVTISGTGLQSDPLNVTTLEGAPEPPQNVTVTNITSTSMNVEWLPPLVMNGVITFYKVQYNSDSIKVESSAAALFNKCSVTLTNLTAYVNYTITVVACTNECSKKSDSVTRRTAIGVPGKLEHPKIDVTNMSQVMVKWKPPSVPGGLVDFYVVRVQQLSGDESTNKSYNTSLTNVSIPTECDTSDLHHSKFIFMVRAVNIGDEVYCGPWSDPSESACYIAGLTETIRAVIWVAGCILTLVLFIVLVYAGRRVWSCCKEMQDLEVKLPPGLAASCEKEKDADYHINMIWPSDENDHHLTGKLLMQQKEDCHGLIPSGDSSGCSSGHESVSSSLTCGTRISSDSGTEVDPSPDAVFANSSHWDGTSLRQRNVSVLRPGDPYVKMGKGSGSASIVRSTPNLTDMDNIGAATGYTCLGGAWSLAGYSSMPSSEEMECAGGEEGPGYCRVALQQEEQQAPIPAKGYVILSTVSASSPQLQQPEAGYVTTAGKDYVMAGEPPSLISVQDGEEDHGIFDLESAVSEIQAPESYCRFGLHPEGSKPSSGYVTLADGPRPRDAASTSGINMVTHGYVPHKQFDSTHTPTTDV